MSLTKQQLIEALTIANSNIEVEMLQSVIAVESGGKGFDPKTGKIMIQFEPHIFSDRTGIERSKLNHYVWDENKVEVQSAEWVAFNDAFKVDANKAMESTSIGLPQIMGFHWKALGYSSVGQMWDEFKKGELLQVVGLIRFLQADARLLKAIKTKDFHTIAYIYNGSKYKELAEKLGREPYNISLQKAYNKFKQP